MPAGILREKKDPRPHRAALFEAAARRIQLDVMVNDLNPRDLTLGAYKRAYCFPTDTEGEVKADQERDALAFEDSRTWPGAIWKLRETEMDANQKRRDEYVAKYRPIQTLDGLDPDPVRLAYREMAKEINATLRTLAGVMIHG